MKVFISYGAYEDQVTALRLQALGAINGLTLYVPPAYTRQGISALIDSEVSQKLTDAEVVLGVVGAGITDACREELNAGLRLGKNMIVMAYPQFASYFRPFGSKLVVIDPFNPGAAEADMVSHLKGINAQHNANRALVALGTLALGLLMLAVLVPVEQK